MAKKVAEKTKSKKSDKPKKNTTPKVAKTKLSVSQTPEQLEAKKWKDFVSEKKIATPFFQIGGGVRRSSDGKPYSSPEQFFADGGNKDWSNVTIAD